jgi:TonB family protein
MKFVKPLTTLFVLSLFASASGQGVTNYYNQGNNCLNSKDYEGAVKYYTLSANQVMDVDTYFNRAIAYLQLRDTCKFCYDLDTAQVYFDDAESRKLIEKHCSRFPKTRTVLQKSTSKMISNSSKTDSSGYQTAVTLLHQGKEALQVGESEKALVLLNQCTANFSLPEAILLRADIQLKAGDTCKACSELRNADGIPDNAIGTAYRKLCAETRMEHRIPADIKINIPDVQYMERQRDICTNQYVLYAVSGSAGLTTRTNLLNINREPVFAIAEEMAQFNGGDKALQNYLKTNLIYPEDAKNAKKKGSVYVSFIVEKDGSLSAISIVKSLDKSCDAEAIRLVKNMPAWIPATSRGKSVRVKLIQPIRFP